MISCASTGIRIRIEFYCIDFRTFVCTERVKIVLNGQEKNFTTPITIEGLLNDMGLAERRVAVEVNREIVPRSRHGEFKLKESDRVEVVFAIGGGAKQGEASHGGNC